MAMSGGSDQFGKPQPGMNFQGTSQGTSTKGEYDEDIKFIKETGSAALKTGWSYLAWGASKVKEKSDESGVSSKLYNAKIAIKTKADE